MTITVCSRDKYDAECSECKACTNEETCVEQNTQPVIKCDKCGATTSKRWFKLYPRGVSCLDCEIRKVLSMIKQARQLVQDYSDKVCGDQRHLEALEAVARDSTIEAKPYTKE